MGYRKTEQPENCDAFSYIKFLLIFANNFIQIHLTLDSLINSNLIEIKIEIMKWENKIQKPIYYLKSKLN